MGPPTKLSSLREWGRKSISEIYVAKRAKKTVTCHTSSSYCYYYYHSCCRRRFVCSKNVQRVLLFINSRKHLFIHAARVGRAFIIWTFYSRIFMYTKMYENILVTNFFPHSTRLFHLQYAAITYGERKKLIIFHKYTRQALASMSVYVAYHWRVWKSFYNLMNCINSNISKFQQKLQATQ